MSKETCVTEYMQLPVGGVIAILTYSYLLPPTITIIMYVLMGIYAREYTQLRPVPSSVDLQLKALERSESIEMREASTEFSSLSQTSSGIDEPGFGEDSSEMQSTRSTLCVTPSDRLHPSSSRLSMNIYTTSTPLTQRGLSSHTLISLLIISIIFCSLWMSNGVMAMYIRAKAPIERAEYQILVKILNILQFGLFYHSFINVALYAIAYPDIRQAMVNLIQMKFKKRVHSQSMRI